VNVLVAGAFPTFPLSLLTGTLRTCDQGITATSPQPATGAAGKNVTSQVNVLVTGTSPQPPPETRRRGVPIGQNERKS